MIRFRRRRSVAATTIKVRESCGDCASHAAPQDRFCRRCGAEIDRQVGVGRLSPAKATTARLARLPRTDRHRSDAGLRVPGIGRIASRTRSATTAVGGGGYGAFAGH